MLKSRNNVDKCSTLLLHMLICIIFINVLRKYIYKYFGNTMTANLIVLYFMQ